MLVALDIAVNDRSRPSTTHVAQNDPRATVHCVATGPLDTGSIKIEGVVPTADTAQIASMHHPKAATKMGLRS